MPTIDVKARYFAAFREQAGCAGEPVRTESRTPADLYRELAAKHGFLDTRDRCKVAVNGAISGWEIDLRDGDEVLFFPPVAGG
jgi:molybdopterin converting factor subunit 1